MRRWLLTRIAAVCGKCGESSPAGTAMLELSAPDAGRWKKLRCPRCADEPIPTSLTTGLSAAKVIPFPFTRVSDLAADVSHEVADHNHVDV